MNERRDLDRWLAALPHGEPFRFVTELSTLDPLVGGSGAWVVTGAEPFFAGHFPGEPIVPGVLLTESLAQLCGLVALSGSGPPNQGSAPARLAQMDVKILTAIRPPARVELATTLVRHMGSLFLFEVAATCGGVAAAEGRIVLASSQPSQGLPH